MRRFLLLVLLFLILFFCLLFQKDIFVAGLAGNVELALPFVPIPAAIVSFQELPPVESEEPLLPQEILSGPILQDQIDDILEKIDLLKRQIADLEAAPIDEDDVPKKEDEKIVLANQEVAPQTPAPAQTQNYVASNKSGGQSKIYPNIIISKVQIGGLTDSKQEFVQLYNPTAKDVDLTDWYVQRKTKTGTSFSSFAPNTLFAGKKIATNGYFLIARQDSGFLGDIFVDNPLTEDNSLVVKNPNGEISDTLGWGLAQEYEGAPALNPPPGRSIGRDENEKDTNNNLADFSVNQLPPATDALPPQTVFTLDAIQKSLDFMVHFDITEATGAVSPSGIGGYIFRWKEEGGDWHEDEYVAIENAPATFFGEKNFSGIDETQYYFQVKAKDIVGNESDWLPATPATTTISLFKKILINEVQTAGATIKDEFIMLYNPNEVAVNMAGFALKKKTSSGNESNLVSSEAFLGIIQPHGYFLIAPQQNDDGTENYTGATSPDIRYSGKTFSIADNNTILIYNADDELLDSIITNEEVLPPEPEPPVEPPVEPEEPALQAAIVINEIAWMGTTVSANSEWIELFNPSDQAVNLSGWVLQSADGSPNITLSASINAHGFYLLERTSDDTVLGITADQIYTGALSNTGEHLYLKNTLGDVVDEVDCTTRWFEGSNTTKQTMQRKDPLLSGNSADNWQTSQQAGGSPKS